MFNPTARRAGRGRRWVEALSDEPATEVRETSGPGDAADLARSARREGVPEVVVAGGDGTLHEVINGLAPFGAEAPGEEGRGGRRAGPVPALGLLPLGTGNDAARSLGVPLDLAEARAALEDGARRTVDLGRVRGRADGYFVNSAVAGVGGRVERILSPRLKRWLGPLSYRVAAVASFRDLPRHRVTVEWNGGEGSILTEAYSVIVANGRQAGAGIPVAPGARTDDGRLDLVVLEAGRATRVPGLVRDVLRGRHLDRDDVRRVRAERVSLRARPPMWVSLDGEVFGDEPLDVEVVPGALTLAVPRGPASETEG